MLVIDSWFGRIGNNILQLVRAIHYAKTKQISQIVFPSHSFFTHTRLDVILDTSSEPNFTSITDNFFNLSKFGITDPEPYQMKKYVEEYLFPIFKISLPSTLSIIPQSHLYIHFRGGDIFNSTNPHPAYVQPPILYYTNIIEKHIKYHLSRNVSAKDIKIILLCEDYQNPCITFLMKQYYTLFKDYSEVQIILEPVSSLEKDLTTFSRVQSLAIGFGTFGFMLYLINSFLKQLYVPEYFYKTLPQGQWYLDHLDTVVLEILIKLIMDQVVIQLGIGVLI